MMKEYTGEILPLTEYSGDVIPLAQNTSRKEQKSQYLPTANEIVGGLQGTTLGMLEPLLQAGSGFIAKPISELGALGVIGENLLTGKQIDPDIVRQTISQKLTYQPQSAMGKMVSEKLLAPIGRTIESEAEKSAKIYGRGDPIAESAIKESIMQSVNMLGIGGAPKAGGMVREANIAKMNALKEKKAIEFLRNDIRKKGNEIGLIAPSEGAIKETLSKIGGAEPHLSMKNTRTATNAIAKEIGLPKGAISDVDIVNRVKDLTKNYSAVTKALGEEIQVTDDFRTNVYSLLEPMKENFTKDPIAFAPLKAPIELLEWQISQMGGKITPKHTMDKIRQLRSDARKFDKDTTGDPAKGAMAEANYKLANLYEDLIDSELSSKGKTGLLESFRDARKKLAQIHVLDSARTAEGLIDMQRLASVTGKYGSDKRMVSGSIKTVADFANTFKNVSRPVGKSEFSTPSRWELMFGLGGIGAAPISGGKSLIFAAPMAARAIAPTLAERGMLQGKIPAYDISMARKAAPFVTEYGLFTGAMSPYAKDNK